MFLKFETENDHEILDANFQEFAVSSKIFHDPGNSKFLFNVFIDSRL
jgi:hypothetical protein